MIKQWRGQKGILLDLVMGPPFLVWKRIRTLNIETRIITSLRVVLVSSTVLGGIYYLCNRFSIDNALLLIMYGSAAWQILWKYYFTLDPYINSDGRSKMLHVAEAINNLPRVFAFLFSTILFLYINTQFLKASSTYTILSTLALLASFWSSYALWANLFKYLITAVGVRFIKPTTLPEDQEACDQITEENYTAILYPVKAGSEDTVHEALRNLEAALNDFTKQDSVIGIYASDTRDEDLILLEIQEIRKLQENIYGLDRIIYVHRESGFGVKWGNVYDVINYFLTGNIVPSAYVGDPALGLREANEPIFGFPESLIAAHPEINQGLHNCSPGILGDLNRLFNSQFRLKFMAVSDFDTYWPKGQLRKLLAKAIHPDNSHYSIFSPRGVIQPLGNLTKYSNMFSWISGFLPARQIVDMFFYDRARHGGKGIIRADQYKEFIELEVVPPDALGHDNFETVGDLLKGPLGHVAFVHDVSLIDPPEANLLRDHKRMARWGWGDIQMLALVHSPLITLKKIFSLDLNPIDMHQPTYEQAAIIDHMLEHLFLNVSYYCFLGMFLRMSLFYLLPDSVVGIISGGAIIISYMLLFISIILTEYNLRHALQLKQNNLLRGLICFSLVFMFFAPIELLESFKRSYWAVVRQFTGKKLEWSKSMRQTYAPSVRDILRNYRYESLGISLIWLLLTMESVARLGQRNVSDFSFFSVIMLIQWAGALIAIWYTSQSSNSKLSTDQRTKIDTASLRRTRRARL